MRPRSRIQTTGPNNGHQLRDYSKSSNRSESPDLNGIIQRVVTDQSPLIYGSKLTVSNGNQTLVYTKYNGTPQHILQAMDFFNRQSVHLIVAANQMESDENK